ncbi:hypothetical protein QYE76_069268 [Lolium multiflorum]|uniref:phosphomevalonate kinase n=1 Tax=Lolium multiflorum TaxID=4521 RepID=A0AAD8SHP7_LOLMU|nr:hypothetical protein QYE76_069268 [Lolium multiflorum]
MVSSPLRPSDAALSPIKPPSKTLRNKPRVVSAPGKVLVAGGYLVLELPNPGIVLSTTARFYAIVRPIHDELSPGSWAWVRESGNPFVEQAIQFSIAAAKAIVTDKEKKDTLDKLLLQGLNITILGSNDFYSYRKQNLVDPFLASLLFLAGFAHLALFFSCGGRWVPSHVSPGAPRLPTAGDSILRLVGDGSRRCFGKKKVEPEVKGDGAPVPAVAAEEGAKPTATPVAGGESH